MCDYSKFLKSINNIDCRVLINEPMKKHTSFKIGGPADLFLEIYSKKDLDEILKSLNKFKIPYYVLGNGSNILVSDTGVRGAILKLSGDFNSLYIKNNKIFCGAGVKLSYLCMFAKNNSLCGTEFLWGIPGTVGGALYMNAGAYGGEIKDIINSCTYISNDGIIFNLSKEKLDLSYRKSRFSNTNDIIVSASFDLKEGNKSKIEAKMKTFLEKRKSKQPLEFPNAGSTFKKPINNFAGALIEECNLKGKTIGDAMVSPKHAGFIINRGNASCEDVVKLIQLVKDTVYKKTGVFLECEIKIIGENFIQGEF